MRFSDTLSGLFTLIFGGAVAVAAWRFPRTEGHNIGPGLFPLLVGGGLVLFGLLLVFSGGRKRDVCWLQIDPALRQPRNAIGGLLVIGALVFYALAVETLGFFITAFIFLAVLLAAFGARRRWIAPIAVGATLALHFAFYTLLRVPLPWGWLEVIAW